MSQTHYIILKHQMQYRNQRLYECLQNVGTRGKIILVIKMKLSERRNNRLEKYDYSQTGAYFITICVKDRKNILSKIVGAGVPDCPRICLLYHGEIADRYIKQLDSFYSYLSVDKYVIMPDHIHLIISVKRGQSRTPAPTNENNKNSDISKFVSTFKRFCNKEYLENIWQRSYYDHIIRNQQDYNEIWEYIENNPEKWAMTKTEKFFSKNT